MMKTLCLLFLLLFFPFRLVNSCELVRFHGYSFWDVTDWVDQNKPFVPFLMKFGYVSKFFVKDSVQREENLQEWRNKFCDYADWQDIKEVIYQSPIKNLELLQTSISSKSLELPEPFKNNTFAEQLKRNHCTETIAYLIFAKKCEPHVVAPADAWSNTPSKYDVIRLLVNDGRDAFLHCESPFLKLRYLYQIIRLAHYTQNYQQVLELYDDLMPKVDSRVRSVIYFWVLGHRAAALRKMGKNAEAAYNYSLLFYHSRGKREQALRSFSISSDEEFKKCTAFCQSDGEKATLYAMRACADDSKAAEEMEAIYELDPKHEFLNYLLLKEVEKLEKDFLGYEFNDQKARNKAIFNIPRPQASDYLLRLQQLVRRAIGENQVLQPELWRMAEGYLELLSGDAYAAVRTFDALKTDLKDPKLIGLIDIYQTVATIGSFQNMNDKNALLADDIRSKNPVYQKNRAFGDFLFDKLSFLYQKAGHKGYAFRCHYDLKALKPNPQLNILDDLITLCRQEPKNGIETYLADNEHGESLLSSLMEMKGTYFLSQYELGAAKDVFAQVPPSVLDDHRFNPFLDKISERVYTAIPDSMQLYNKRQIVEQLLDWEFRAKADVGSSGEYYYNIANSLYNMSYFGASWGAMDYYRSGALWASPKTVRNLKSTYYYPFGNRENVDLARPLQYAQQGYAIAKDRNPEVAAKCLFLIARCLEKQYFQKNNLSNLKKIPNLPPEVLQNFDLIKRFYSNTAFYKEILRECKYFR